jgi:hypothetical protein
MGRMSESDWRVQVRVNVVIVCNPMILHWTATEENVLDHIENAIHNRLNKWEDEDGNTYRLVDQGEIEDDYECEELDMEDTE